jgi:RimJ/RimL family protein N-acetyltransferase
MQHHTSVSELEQADIPLIVAYWSKSDRQHLANMGIDVAKIPSRDELYHWLQTQLDTPIEKRNAYCMIWKVNGIAIGHSNTNPTTFGEEAYMHLHIWNNELRKKGLGTSLLRLTLPYYFENLKLRKLYCQPYALNPAPNKTLEKAGFHFVKEYVTTPGWLNFEQPVCLWEMSAEKFNEGLF